MVTLRVIVDSVLEGTPRGIARYTEELARALIRTAPRDCDVEAIVAASSEQERAELADRLPGLAGVHRIPLGRRELYAAWQHRMSTVPLHGMVHSTTLLAPLRSHDRVEMPGEQTAVTLHDANPWLDPATAGSRAGWVRAMAKRAHRYADAIVVPTHAVAADLQAHLDFGDRVRVIGGAPSLTLPAADETAAIRDRLGLPLDYLVAIAALQPRKALRALLAALALPGVPAIPLALVGGDPAEADALATAVEQSGLPYGQVVSLGALPDPELAVVLAGATAYVLPSLSEGFGLSAVEAFSLGTPVIHSDAPALVEVSDGAGVLVEREPAHSYAERLAEAITATVLDGERRRVLSILGRDRARAFSWRDSAEKVWQLHADL